MAAAFTPNSGEIIVGAFSRIGVRRTQITVTHLSDARHEANLLQAQWGNRGPNLWTVEAREIALQAGVGTYKLAADVIEVESAFVSYAPAPTGSDVNMDAGGDSVLASQLTTDRQLSMLGRDEYLDIPNKQQQGMTTAYWFQRGLVPSLNLWPVPADVGTLYYWVTRNIMTASVSDAAGPEVPYLWLDAFTAGLAHRLARIYAPAMEAVRKGDANEAWDIAAEQDTEKTPMSFNLDTGRYWR